MSDNAIPAQTEKEAVIPSETSAVNPPARKPGPVSKIKPAYIIGCVIVLLIAFVLTGAIALKMILGTNSSANSSTSSNSTSSESITSSASSSLAAVTSKLYYIKNANVFQYDVDSQSAEQLTSEVGSTAQFMGIKVLDANTVSFAKCTTTTGDFGCGIYTLDISTKTVTQIRSLPADALLMSYDMVSPDLYAYLMSDNTNWQFHIVKNGTDTTLDSVAVNAYGRGGFDEDSQKIAFSPDAKYVLQIATSSPRSSSDFNIYFYNVTTGAQAIITGATQPDWIDNSTFVYHKYASNTDDGLYTYDVSSSSAKKISVVSVDARDPKAINNGTKILYSIIPDHEVWLYDLTTHTNTKLLDHAQVGIWLSDTKFAFNDELACADPSSCNSMTGDFEAVDAKVTSISDPTTVQSISGLESTYNTASLYDN